MIRWSTIALLVLLSGLTGALFLVKHQVQNLERQVTQVEESLRSYRNNIRILQAEWTLLTSPQRLRGLRRPDGLAPLTGSQFKRFSDLPDSFVAQFASTEEGRAPEQRAGRPGAPARRPQ